MVTQTSAAPPTALRLAAAVQAVEGAGLAIAAVFAAISTADGKSYQVGSGIALTVIALATAVALVAFAVGLLRVRPWTRTPVVMIQVFVIIAGVILLDGHRPEWGIPALVLAAGCLAGLFTPASLQALNRPPAAPEPKARPGLKAAPGPRPAPVSPVAPRPLPPKAKAAAKAKAKSQPAKRPTR